MNNEKQMVLNKRQVSWLVSVVLFVLFITFVIGYYVGRNSDISQSVPDGSADDGAQEPAGITVIKMQELPPQEPEAVMCKEPEVDDVNDEPVESRDWYYAELIGFGTKKAAESFVNRLQKQGEPVLLKERVSTTNAGKKIAWYQAVTESFDTKEHVATLIQKYEKQEKLRGIVIRKYS